MVAYINGAFHIYQALVLTLYILNLKSLLQFPEMDTTIITMKQKRLLKLSVVSLA